MLKALMPALLLVAVASFGCGDVVITINFPEAKIKERAQEDVKDMREANQPADTDNDGLQQFDEDIDIDKKNKEIDEIKARIKKRYEDHLMTYYDKGNVGEKNDGYIALRNTDGLNLKQKAAVKKLVKAENEDRGKLYGLVAKINKVPKEVDKVAKLYAQQWRANAKDNHYVQDDDGKWMTKKDWKEAQKKKDK